MYYLLCSKPHGSDEHWRAGRITSRRDTLNDSIARCSYRYYDVRIDTYGDRWDFNIYAEPIKTEIIEPDEELNRKNDGRWYPDDWQYLKVKDEARAAFIAAWDQLPQKERIPWLNEIWRKEHPYPKDGRDYIFPPAPNSGI